MRQDIMNLVKGIKTVSYKVSEELPFSNSNQPLYLKNPKSIYVDETQFEIQELIPVMNGVNIETEIKTTRIYFSNDAKQQPRDYQQLISDIKNIKDDIVGDYFKRECLVTTDYENDLSVTTLEFRFSTIYKGN